MIFKKLPKELIMMVDEYSLKIRIEEAKKKLEKASLGLLVFRMVDGGNILVEIDRYRRGPITCHVEFTGSYYVEIYKIDNGIRHYSIYGADGVVFYTVVLENFKLRKKFTSVYMYRKVVVWKDIATVRQICGSFIDHEWINTNLLL